MSARRGISLVEVITVIVVLAIAVPPSLRLVGDSVNARIDAINLTRATTLASALAEHLLADIASDDTALAFAALADPDAWEAGFRARAAATAAPYDAVGITYDLAVGSLTDAHGVATGDAGEDVYREVAIAVTYRLANGATATYTLELVVTELSP